MSQNHSLGFDRSPEDISNQKESLKTERDFRSSLNYSRESEFDIWDDFNSGNESAFIYIYNTYYKHLLSFGRQLSTNKQVIEDCIQDMFIDLRKKRGRLNKLKVSIKAYLFQILKHQLYDIYAKKREFSTYNELENDKNFVIILPNESYMIQEEEQNALLLKLNASVKNLTLRQREVLYYMFYKNMSYEEVKTIMGFDHVKSVRNLFYQAIDILKLHIKLSLIYWAFFY
ncbi:MAG: RNA polymerase sigma factor [Cyclobacteriaceae bacterium]